MKNNVIFLDVENEKVDVVDMGEDIYNTTNFNKKLDCMMIDILPVHIGIARRGFVIVCDKDWMDKDLKKLKISAINDNAEPVLYGNLIVCQRMYGMPGALTDEEVEYLRPFFRMASTTVHPVGYPMLTQCHLRNALQRPFS